MTKMTRTMRDAITTRILDRIRLPREVALRRRENALATRLVSSRYGDDVFGRCHALPDGWLPLCKQIPLDSKLVESFPRHTRRVQSGRYPVDVRFPRGVLELAEYVPLPYSVRDCCWTADDIRGKLYDDLHAWYGDHAELHEQLENLYLQVVATLASFTTVEKLADGWPEGYAELPQEMLAPVGGLPAPRIADLNARIAALREAA